MDTASCHISESSSLHIGSHDQSPASSISKDLDILTSPASNIVSPPIMSPRRGQNRSKQLTTSNSKKELEIAEILSMLGSSSTKLLVEQPERVELHRPQLYSDLGSYTVSIERVEQEFRHCVAQLPQDGVTQGSHTKEDALPDVEKNDSSVDLPLASTITLPTTLSLSLPTMLPPWSSKSDFTPSLKPWGYNDKVSDKSVTESYSVQPLGLFVPRVFNNNISKQPFVPSTSHHSSNNGITTSASVVGPSSSTHVTTSIVDPVLPSILPSSQFITNSRPPPTTATTATTTTSNMTRSLSNKFIIGGLALPSNDMSRAATTTTTSYMPINTVLPFPFISAAASVSMSDTATVNSKGIIPSSSVNSSIVGGYPTSSTQQPHIIGGRPLLEVDADSVQRRLYKKRNRSSTDTGSSVSLDMLSHSDNAATPTRSQAGMNTDFPTLRPLPTMMPPNMTPPSSVSNDVVTTQPDFTKTPLLAYPYQPNFFPYMFSNFSRPMVPMNWLERMNPTSTIRPPIYPSLMQSSPLIGFDPSGTLFKPQPQFTPNMLSSPFLHAGSFGNNLESPSLQQPPPVRPFMASNPATPTSTLSPTPQSSSLPVLTRESPLLHSSFTNLSSFGNNSSIGLNGPTVTPPIITSAEISPSRSVITGSWPPFHTQMSPMLGFGLTPGKFGAANSNQSPPLLGAPHTVLPVSCSPLLVSQLGNVTDGGNKRDNNIMPSANQPPVPDSKHVRRHHHHHPPPPPKEQHHSDRNDPKHKPGVIAFAGNNKLPTSGCPVTQSDCYVVVPSPGSSTAAINSSVVLTTNSNYSPGTSEHQSTPRAPTSVHMQQNELTSTPTVLPFQSLVSKMMVKKPRGRKQTKNMPENKDNSPKRPGRRGRKPAPTSAMSSIITPSVVETLAGTSLLDVIAPSGLDMRELPGNKKEVQSKRTSQHVVPIVVTEHIPQQHSSKPSIMTDDHHSSSQQPLVEVSVSICDNTSPAKLDSACSLLSLSQSVPVATSVTAAATGNSTATLSPVVIADKEDGGEALAQVRRPSSVTAAEAMLMFTNVVDEKCKVAEKSPPTKPLTDDVSKAAEASTDDVVIVVQDEGQVEEADNVSKEDLVCEEKVKDNSKEDDEVNHTIAPPPASSPSSNDGTKENDHKVVTKNSESVSETDHTEIMDTTTVDDTVNSVSVEEEVALNVDNNDPVSEETTLQDTGECSSTVDKVDAETSDTHGNNPSNISSDIKNDTNGDVQDDTNGNMQNDTNVDIQDGTNGDMQDDTTVHMNQLAVTEIEISADDNNNDDDDEYDNNDDIDGDDTVEHSSENHTTMEQSELKGQADNKGVDVQDDVVTDGASGVKGNWEEVSDDELLDADLTPPLVKKSKTDDDDGQSSDKPSLMLNIPQVEESGNNATVSSEASTPLLDDNVAPARQVSVSSCISLYDDAMFENDTFENTAIGNAQTVNGDACENGVDNPVTAPTVHHVEDVSKPIASSKIKQINPNIMARRKYRTHSIDNEGSSYVKESRRDTNTLTLPDDKRERNKSASPRRKLQPDSTTSPKELETEHRDSLHNSADRNEWNSRSYKNRERGRNSRKQPVLYKSYGDHYDRQQGGGTQRYAQSTDYRSGGGAGRPNNSTWNSTSHYKHSGNNNYNNQHYSHYQQNHTGDQDARRTGQSNYKRHTSHYRQDSNKNRNSGRDTTSQWSKRDYHGRKQEGCDSGSHRGSNTKFQQYSQDGNTSNHHHNNRTATISLHPHYSSQSLLTPRHGDRSYEQVSDEEPSSTAASFKHQSATGMLSISEASNSAISDNSNSGSGSDSELESNHSSASRPVSRASSVKSSSSRSNKERLYARKEPSSQRNRHHPYHHSKHNSSTGYSRRH